MTNDESGQLDTVKSLTVALHEPVRRIFEHQSGTSLRVWLAFHEDILNPHG